MDPIYLPDIASLALAIRLSGGYLTGQKLPPHLKLLRINELNGWEIGANSLRQGPLGFNDVRYFRECFKDQFGMTLH
jgi:hypothetical protein